jgi:hypothetical protein
LRGFPLCTTIVSPAQGLRKRFNELGMEVSPVSRDALVARICGAGGPLPADHRADRREAELTNRGKP